jgi:hypothetical protein
MKVIKNGRGTRKCKKCGVIFVVYIHANKYAHICGECRKAMNHEKHIKMRAAWGLNHNAGKLVTHDIKKVQKRI